MANWMTHDMSRARAETNRINDLVSAGRDADGVYGRQRIGSGSAAQEQPLTASEVSAIDAAKHAACAQHGHDWSSGAWGPIECLRCGAPKSV
jgi:hypothetical protein